MNDSPGAHLITRLDGTVLWANRTLASWIGMESEELEGLSLNSLLTSGGRIHYESILPSLALGSSMHNISLDLRKADGTTLHLLASTTTVVSLSGNGDDAPHEVRWVCIDVTGRRSQERDLLVSQRRLSRLQNLSTALATAHTDNEIGTVLLAQLVDGVKADHGVVVSNPVDGDSSVLTEYSAPPGVRLAADPKLVDWAAQAVQDGDPVFESVVLEGKKIQLAALPLRGSEGLLGFVLLELTRDRPHDEEEQSLLVAASQMCEQALDRARLLETHRRDAERNAALSGLLHRLEEATTVAGRAQLIADFLVPEHADYATVEMPAAGPEPVGLRHSDLDLEDLLRALRTEVAIKADLPHSLASGRETRQPQHMDLIDPAVYEQYGLTDVQLEKLRVLAPRSYLGLPLVARNSVIGSLLLAFSTSSRSYGKEEVDFYQRIADSAALSLENARLYEHERHTAQELQKAFMPSVSLGDLRVRVGTFYQPGIEMNQIGGDWYDAFMVSEDRLGLVVGDIVGGGITAATAMAQVQTAIHAYAMDGGGVALTLERLNRFVGSVPGAVASSLVYAEIDLADGRLTYGSAGHPPPVLVAPGDSPKLLWGARTTLLGISDQTTREETITLTPGSTLLLYTDGLIEKRGRAIDEGLQALVEALAENDDYAGRPGRLTEVLDSDTQDDICVITATWVDAHIEV